MKHLLGPWARVCYDENLNVSKTTILKKDVTNGDYHPYHKRSIVIHLVYRRKRRTKDKVKSTRRKQQYVQLSERIRY